MKQNLKKNLVELGKISSSKKTIRLAGILHDSITDGPGLRFVMFTQGCGHHCDGCHNKETWSMSGGTFYSAEQLLKEIESNPLIQGVTFSGGEPLLQARELIFLASAIKEKGLEIAVYSGFLFENIIKDDDKIAFLSFCDILIDGKFEISKKSYALKFKGSSNQRTLDVQNSFNNKKAMLTNDERWA